MKIVSHKLFDERFGNQWFDEVEDRWDYEDFLKDERWRKGWISMDCALYDNEDKRVYLGISTFDPNGIFKAFDTEKKEFMDLGYERIADPYDAKFHQALVKRKKDGCIYGAVALFHDCDRNRDAPGGAIVRYNPKTGEIKKLAIPMPHNYIQSITLDEERDLLYCQCFPPEYVISYNLETGEIVNFGIIGTGKAGNAECENLVLDDDGNVWAPWSTTRAWQRTAGKDCYRIFTIPAGSDRIKFFKKGLPKRDGSYGYEKMDAIFNFHDGYIYASGGNGSLYRIDREDCNVKYLFTPIDYRPSRLSSMVIGPDGCAYGVTGRDGKCRVLRFDFKNKEYELLDDVIDQDGEACWQIHCVTTDGKGTLYACENDNPYRSGYLWEIKL